MDDIVGTRSPLSLIRQGRHSEGGLRLRVVRHLSREEAAQYEAASEHIFEFERSRDLLWIVDENLSTLKQYLALLGESVSQDAKSRRNRTSHLARQLNGQVVNYLNSMRLYLDHRSTQLKRRYGAAGAPFLTFEDARRTVFDHNPVYRFVYIFRNYVQHCGMPLQIVRAGESLVEDAGHEIRKVSLFVGCDRETLLKQYSEWRHAKEFLEKQEDEFELLPLLAQSRNLLWRIEEAVTRAQVSSLWPDARSIVTLLSEACDSESAGTIAEVIYDTQVTTPEEVVFHNPPLNTLRNLKLIVTGGLNRPWQVNSEVLALEYPPTLV